MPATLLTVHHPFPFEEGTIPFLQATLALSNEAPYGRLAFKSEPYIAAVHALSAEIDFHLLIGHTEVPVQWLLQGPCLVD
jgi:hypothetical protein